MGRETYRNNHQLLIAKVTAVLRIFSNSRVPITYKYTLLAQQRNGSKF